MMQIEVANNTPYRRRIFLHPVELSVKEPIPLMLAAWKHFDLGPGESIGTALGSIRVGARVATGTTLDHRTVAADVEYGERVTFGMKGGIPMLTRDQGERTQIQVCNGLEGSDITTISATIYMDYAPCMSTDVPPRYTTAVTFPGVLFAYASKPITDGSSALVFEPAAGKVELRGDVRLKLVPSKDGTTIRLCAGT